MPPGSSGNSRSLSTLNGTSRIAVSSATWVTSSSRVTCWSSLPIERPNPALVVASALKPRSCRMRAEPRSHGFGITKQPCWCSGAERVGRASSGPPSAAGRCTEHGRRPWYRWRISDRCPRRAGGELLDVARGSGREHGAHARPPAPADGCGRELHRLHQPGRRRRAGRAHDRGPPAGRARRGARRRADGQRRGWHGYLSHVPDYVIHPRHSSTEGGRVAVVGTTTGSHLGLADDEELQLDVVWVADVVGGRLASWQIVEDGAEFRRGLGLPRWAPPDAGHRDERRTSPGRRHRAPAGRPPTGAGGAGPRPRSSAPA